MAKQDSRPLRFVTRFQPNCSVARSTDRECNWIGEFRQRLDGSMSRCTMRSLGMLQLFGNLPYKRFAYVLATRRSIQLTTCCRIALPAGCSAFSIGSPHVHYRLGETCLFTGIFSGLDPVGVLVVDTPATTSKRTGVFVPS